MKSPDLWTKAGLIEFEEKMLAHWKAARIPYPVHFSGGNEEFLIDLFRKEIGEDDWILGTHRAHYHYLLSGGKADSLEEIILRGDSMHIFDAKMKFLTSAIVAGVCGIAAGIARGIREKNGTNRVWCFVGDGAEDEGHFYEAVRYVNGHRLPCTFVLEDNDRSVETPKNRRWGDNGFSWPGCVRRYSYEPTYPHVGDGTFVVFGGKSGGGNSF